jgi:hypothetical protein
MRWIIGIVAVVVIAILGYQYFGGARDVDVAGQVEQGADQAAQEAGEAAEATGQAVEESAEAVTEGAQETAEQATEAAQDAAEDAAGAAQQAQETAEQAAEGAQEMAEEAADSAEQATEEAAEATESATEQAGEAAGAVEESLTEAQTAALTVGDVNVGAQLNEIVQSAETSLEGITDAQSAEAAVPALNQINSQLEQLSGTVGQLPEDAKKVLADLLGDQVTELKTLAESVANQEGVGAVLNPVLEPIMAKLDSWAQQPA